VNYWTEEIIDGGKHLMIDVPLDELPIFIKRGTFVAHGDFKLSTGTPDQQRTIHLYRPANGKVNFNLYEDDGVSMNGDQLYLDISGEISELKLEFELKKEGRFKPSWKKIDLKIHLAKELQNVYLNGKLLPGTYDRDKKVYTVSFSL
jgi:alpha-glucosidase